MRRKCCDLWEQHPNPRLLVKDERFRKLSSDAKMAYGLMLDRMSLSKKNGWLDDSNRAYIMYTIDELADDIGCSKNTCVKIMKELDSGSGIGLIERRRSGLGRPDVIYVKNFASGGESIPSGKLSTPSTPEQGGNPATPDGTETAESRTDSQSTKICDSRVPNIAIQESQNLVLQNANICDSGIPKSAIQESQELGSNYTDNNYTEFSKTDVNQQEVSKPDISDCYNNPINPIVPNVRVG